METRDFDNHPAIYEESGGKQQQIKPQILCKKRSDRESEDEKKRTIGIKEMKEIRRERKHGRKQAQTQGPEAGDHLKRKSACLYQKMVFPFTLILYG